MHERANRVFLYGIDAGTWEFILPNIDKLPNFKKLINESIWGELESTIPPITPAAWTSMFSGVLPQKHKIFGFTENTDPVSIKPPSVSKSTIKYPLLWDIFSEKNKFVVAAFIPFAYPPPKIKGLFISGMGTPSAKSNFVYPSSRKSEILDFGVNPDIPHEELIEDYDSMKKTYFENMRNSMELVKYLMEYDPWNLFIYVVDEIDRIQHVFWKFIDPAHPLYDEKAASEYASTILEAYKIADDFLGYLYKELPSDCTLMLASDHGMGPNYRRIVLNNWLYKNGYLEIKGELTESHNKSQMNLVKKIVKKFGLWDFASKIYRKFYPKKMAAIKRWNIDWSKTIAYSLHPFLINMNKQPCKYGRLNKRDVIYCRDEIIEKLKKDNLFGDVGVYSDRIDECVPDIYVKPTKPTDFPIPFSNSGAEIIQKPVNGGEHRINGIYAIHTDKENSEKKNAHIVDITPTILSIIGYDIPEHMDGKSII